MEPYNVEWKLPVRVSPCSLLSWQRFLLTEPVILPKLIYMKSFEALRSGVCRRGNSEFAEFFFGFVAVNDHTEIDAQ